MMSQEFVDPRMREEAYPADSSFDITIGEALEATAYSAAGGKAIDKGDAAAIKASELRALRSNDTLPGGIGAQAEHAADYNARIVLDENKTTLSDVLADATAQLPVDRAARREDAEGVISAEIRNKPDMMRETPGGVAESIAAAATFNQNP